MALIPALALTATAPTPARPAGDESKGLRLVITATTERIPLGQIRGAVEMSVDALSRRIRLRPTAKGSAAGLAARIAAHVGILCPEVQVKDGAVELSCRSRRIEAQITPEGKTSYLDINELRGLPWRAGPDAPPSFHYDPWRLGLGHSCPGKSEASRAECELKDGHVLEAAALFRAALATTNRPMACVRLGDIALSSGDAITASGWYRRAGSLGFFGRISESRQCELDGKCLGSTEEVLKIYDPSGLPEPMRAESLMRAARAEAYAGRLPSAAQIVGRQARAHGMASICREGGELLCRRIVLEAMRVALAAAKPAATVSNRASGPAPGGTPAGKPLDQAEREYLEDLMDTYLRLPSWERGDLAVEMAQAAAPLAARMGATAFGGTLLASLAPVVPPSRLSDHLLMAAETFLEGEHWARAHIVTEYAKTRLGPKDFKTARWTAVLGRLSGRAEHDEVTPLVRAAIEAEMAATIAELKNAQGTLAKVESLLGGAHDAKTARKPAAAKPSPAAAVTAANQEGAR